MPEKGYNQTEEHRLRKSLAMRGDKNTMCRSTIARQKKSRQMKEWRADHPNFKPNPMGPRGGSFKGRIAWNKNLTKETDIRVLHQSLANTNNPKLREPMLGEFNPNWNGGTSRFPYDFKFDNNLKNEIRAEAGYVCQLCGMSEFLLLLKLHCHHIDYNKQLSSKENLIALCQPCNAKVNKNRKLWEEYFRWKKIPQLSMFLQQEPCLNAIKLSASGPKVLSCTKCRENSKE